MQSQHNQFRLVVRFILYTLDNMKIDFQCFKTILERLEARIKRQLVKIALLQTYEIFSDSSMTEKTC